MNFVVTVPVGGDSPDTMDRESPQKERAVFEVGIADTDTDPQEVPENSDVFDTELIIPNGVLRSEKRAPAVARSVSFEVQEVRNGGALMTESASVNSLGDIADAVDPRKKTQNRFGRRNLSGVLAPRLTSKDQKDFTVATPEEFVSRYGCVGRLM